MNESLGMAKTTEELFSQLDLIGKKLENFSLTIDKKRDDVFNLLRQFGQGIQQDFSASGQVTDGNGVEAALQSALLQIQNSVNQWDEAMKVKAKGVDFMSKHEKYLVVMVFGAVKSGKSSLGNLFAGNAFRQAPFDLSLIHI